MLMVSPMRSGISSSFLRRRAAFTFPEAIVTMALLLAFSVVAGGAFFGGQSAFSRQDERSRRIHDELNMIQMVYQVCQKVRVPQWASLEFSSHTTSENLVFGYLDGVMASEVTFSLVDGVLMLKTPTGQWAWKHLQGAKLERWKPKDQTIGVVVSWNGTSGPQAVHFLLGSQSL